MLLLIGLSILPIVFIVIII